MANSALDSAHISCIQTGPSDAAQASIKVGSFSTVFPPRATEILHGVAQQDLPLRVEVTLHLNDLIPISIISGLTIIQVRLP